MYGLMLGFGVEGGGGGGGGEGGQANTNTIKMHTHIHTHIHTHMRTHKHTSYLRLETPLKLGTDGTYEFKTTAVVHTAIVITCTNMWCEKWCW